MSDRKYYNKQQNDLFKKIFEVTPHSFTDKDAMFAAQKWQFDIVKFDDFLSKNDPNYDNKLCTYKGRKNFSISKYLITRYGQNVCNLVEDLMNANFDRTIYPEEEL